MEYLAVGHVSRDELPDGSVRLGGTVTYASLTAAALGWKARALTCAAWPLDLPAGVTWEVRPAAQTTTFYLQTGAEGRTLFLKARADTLTPADLPADWPTPQVLHLGPIAAECALEWVEVFAGRTLVGVTLQGWLRQADETGRVHYAEWEQAEAVLPRVQVAVLSREDVAGDEGCFRRWARLCPLLVVTDGPRRVTWFAGGDGVPHELAVTPRPEVDATGAGDIFAAALFIALAQGYAPAAAIRWAACLAGGAVTRPGLAGVPQAQDLALCPLEGRS